MDLLNFLERSLEDIVCLVKAIMQDLRINKAISWDK